MNSLTTNRRQFIQSAGAFGAAAGLFHFVPSQVLGREGQVGANEQLLVGVIGCGGRANQLMKQLPSEGRIVAVADCYLARAEASAAAQ